MKYAYKTTPVADRKSMIIGDKYRFTVITSRLIRIEYNETGYFEDSATQTVINRNFETPLYSVEEKEGELIITTENIELTYTKQPFSPNSLQVKYVGRNSGVRAGEFSSSWGYGTATNRVFDGTARTLDGVDGECILGKSVMSDGCVAMLDDSDSLLICENGDICTRKEKYTDQYLFCYGDIEKKYNYKACLSDFYKLTGYPPLLPRFVFGNWWSRYHAYTQEEYTNLVKRFKDEDIPFSVAVIDMDWHYVDIDPRFGTGWTGYTWNEKLFPDHVKFLEFLNKEGMVSSLNLHPQEGVHAHEKAYKDMAAAMGIDYKTQKPIPFEIENPKFIENYFKYLHHPLEDEGVRFWWVDWQSGNTTKIPGLDPLWMLNHLHYIDNSKNNNRGLLFSRYAGPGSHRYPIGFSGDTIISWKSLDFQPYFTASASNIGYCWWSHDIGGFMNGYRDEELMARWVQLGVFSPVNRLHSDENEFIGKEPWRYNKIVEISMKKFLKFRHELIPYLYSMNYRTATLGEPLVKPLYYEYPLSEPTEFKNEYLFGSEMMVSPITSPHDEKTVMGSVKTYIPDGVWYDFFNNTLYNGGKTITMFRNLYEMPVLVKSGGIIPMAKLNHINDIENPKDMRIKVFMGNSNSFDLYEDDGNTDNYKNGAFAITSFELKWDDLPSFIINEPSGDISLIPSNRNYNIEFIGIEKGVGISVVENNTEKHFEEVYSNNTLTVRLKDVAGKVIIRFDKKPGLKTIDKREMLFKITERFEKIPNIDKTEIFEIINKDIPIQNILSELIQLRLDEKILLSLCEIITADQ